MRAYCTHMGAFCLLLLSAIALPSRAEWTENGVRVCTNNASQSTQKIVSDGNGGAIIAWHDFRVPHVSHIYAQRIDADGDLLWNPLGVGVRTGATSAFKAAIVSDGEGGAVIAWEDERAVTRKDIYAQKVDANGVVQWTADGVAVCTVAGNKWDPEIASDGEGGAIITWWNSAYDIRAQRIDSGGSIVWGPDGFPVCRNPGIEAVPRILSDGTGGAFIVWDDDRTPTTGTPGIYGQRLDADGLAQWKEDGVPIIVHPTYYATQARLIPDGQGGVILACERTDSDIYAQRFDGNGTPLWGPGGVVVCSYTNWQYCPEIAPDNTGGAIITWEDHRYEVSSDDPRADVYVQRIDGEGNRLWAVDGVALCPGVSNHRQWSPEITTDQGGGAIITWLDGRRVPVDNHDVYAQRIGADGGVLWAEEGVGVCVVDGAGHMPPVITSDGAWGAIISFWDIRTMGGPGLVWAMRVGPNGTIPPTAIDTEFRGPTSLVQNFPNPFNPDTRIAYSVREPCHVLLAVYDASGRLIRTLDERRLEKGQYHAMWDGRDERGRSVASGVYFCRLHAGSDVHTRKMILLR